MSPVMMSHVVTPSLGLLIDDKLVDDVYTSRGSKTGAIALVESCPDRLRDQMSDEEFRVLGIWIEFVADGQSAAY